MRLLTIVLLSIASSSIAQEVWTPHGVARIEATGVVLYDGDTPHYLTFSEKEVDLAYMCGMEDWLFVLRSSDYQLSDWEYPHKLAKLYRVNLKSGVEEYVDFEGVTDLTSREDWKGLGTPPLSKRYFFDGDQEALYVDGHFATAEDCPHCYSMYGMPATSIDAGCTYPYLYITIPGWNAYDMLHRYDVVRNEDKIISLAMGPQVIQQGPLRGNIVGMSTTITEGGRKVKKIVFDDEGERLKDIGAYANDALNPGGLIDAWVMHTERACSDCQSSQNVEQPARQLMPEEVRFDFSGTNNFQTIGKVAVVSPAGIDCRGNERQGKDLASYLESALLGMYGMVERRNLREVLDEQELALSGLMYEQTTIEAGRNLGAQGIIFAEFGCVDGVETIHAKLVDCESAELYWSCTGYGVTTVEFVKRLKSELSSCD